MTRADPNPSRGRRTQRRAAERRGMRAARRDFFQAQQTKRLQVPEQIRALADQPQEGTDA